jgi:hypothetical protein
MTSYLINELICNSKSLIIDFFIPKLLFSQEAIFRIAATFEPSWGVLTLYTWPQSEN